MIIGDPIRMSIQAFGDAAFSILNEQYENSTPIRIGKKEFISTNVTRNFDGQETTECGSSIQEFRREQTPWNGEGLPPVGTVCEFYDATLHRWFEVVIAYSSSWVVVVRGKCSDGEAVEISLRSESAELRPIRTPEQIAAEERKRIEEEIQRICTEGENSGVPFFVALYDAGYRKQEQK